MSGAGVGSALSTLAGPFISSDALAGGVPFTILQPRIIRLGAQIRF